MAAMSLTMTTLTINMRLWVLVGHTGDVIINIRKNFSEILQKIVINFSGSSYNI